MMHSQSQQFIQMFMMDKQICDNYVCLVNCIYIICGSDLNQNQKLYTQQLCTRITLYIKGIKL